jgi:hypothetical protein
MRRCLVSVLLLWAGGVALAEERSAVERGRDAVRGRPPLNPALVSQSAYDNMWKQWGLAGKPADYDRAFRDRYGLALAPYDNHGLPVGFHEVRGLLGRGVGNDCLLCHAGSIAGQTVIGLGNASLDPETLYKDLFGAGGLPFLPITFSHVRGTIEASSVVGLLMQFRDADLNLQAPSRFDLPQYLCQDIPPWWHLKKKKTMTHTGSIDARSVRANMPFALGPLNSGEFVKRQESLFTDIHAYILTLEPPRYPFPIDRALAERGRELFNQTCARCHGTYGPGGRYPNKVVPLAKIGTDPTLAKSLTPEGLRLWNASWFAHEKGPNGELFQAVDRGGYQAPPLDGAWATAPYLHNGAVPTVYGVLNSKTRPKVFTRSYRTEKEDYDPVRLGWKITVLNGPPDAKLPAVERRKIYDTTQPGRGNGGHTFGDPLTEAERMAVIEYLKTL